MITELAIDNFRGFAKFEVNGVKPVNLIVGRNNGGKTSLLEAIHIGGSRGDYSAIQAISTRRGEQVSLHTGTNTSQAALDITCFYHDYKVEQCSAFVIKGDGDLGTTEVYVREIEPQDFNSSGGHGSVSYGGQSSVEVAGFPTAFVIERHFNGDHLDDTVVNGGSVFRRGRVRSSVFPFVSADSLQASQLRSMWDQVLARGDEQRIYDALRIIQPDVEDVQFLSSNRTHGGSSTAGIVVRRNGSRSRVPLGSFGDGMRRLLSLAVVLGSAEVNHCVLIDEIDTGLHHSVLAPMWELIIQTALERQVQIFATTHSLDCLKGLAAFCERSSEHANDVAVHKVDCEISSNILVEGKLVKDFLGTLDPR